MCVNIFFIFFFFLTWQCMQAYYRYSSNNNHSKNNDDSNHHASMIDPMSKRESNHHRDNNNSNNTTNKCLPFSRLLRSRVYIHWRAAFVLLVAICIGAILFVTSPIHAPNSIRDYESVFASITNRRVTSKWQGYLNRKTLASPSHPKRKKKALLELFGILSNSR